MHSIEGRGNCTSSVGCINCSIQVATHSTSYAEISTCNRLVSNMVYSLVSSHSKIKNTQNYGCGQELVEIFYKIMPFSVYCPSFIL